MSRRYHDGVSAAFARGGLTEMLRIMDVLMRDMRESARQSAAEDRRRRIEAARVRVESLRASFVEAVELRDAIAEDIAAETDPAELVALRREYNAASAKMVTINRAIESALEDAS